MKLDAEWTFRLRRLLLALVAAGFVQLVVQSYNFILVQHRRESHAMATRITAEQVVLRIEEGVRTRLEGLRLLTTLDDQAADTAIFRLRAEGLISQFPDFQAVNWIDAHGIIRLVVPLRGNEGALGRSLAQHPDPGVPLALSRAIEDGGPHRTGIITLLQGGRGFACYYRNTNAAGRTVGVVNGVFRVERLLDACLPEDNLRRRYNISLITDTRQVAYEVHRDRVLPEGIRPAQLPVTIIDPGWTFQMVPTRAYLQALASPFEDLLPWLGHLFSLLTALLTWYLFTLRRKGRRGEARYRELFQSSLDGVFILDRHSKLVEANPAALAIFGYQRAEVLFQPISRLGQNRDKLLQLQQVLRAEGAIRRREVNFFNRHGREICCLLSATVRRNESGGFEGVMGILSDITEHQQTREQLRQAQKMEAIGHLAGGVAHDFNNLLTVISGNCELAMMQLGEDNPARIELREIRTTSGRAANLTRQLLAFSRKQVIQPRLLNANDTLHDMDRMLRRIIGETIELGCELHPAAWTVRVDPAQLEQVIVNLAVNARDAMEKGGRLTIRTCNETADDLDPGSGVSPGDYLVIEISDTGCGMPPDVVEHIFEPFFTTKPEGVGTGLGLATVYGIIHQSEGHVQVRSALGEGTTFRILLPRQHSVPVEEREKCQREIPGGSETLLVVEDEPAVRRMTVDSLKRQGYTVHEAGNGRMALELARRLGAEINLVVSDVVMPEMGGVEFVSQLRQLRPDMPVLFLSGYSEEAIRRHGELQADARLLQKPFDLHELHSHVRELLHKAV
jgi:PAS domain S-box-containing protein